MRCGIAQSIMFGFLTILAGCDSSDNIVSVEISEISGFWDIKAASSEPNDANYVFYMFIDGNNMYQYDYQQDDSGTGENCFDLISGNVHSDPSGVSNGYRFSFTSNALSLVTWTSTFVVDGDNLLVDGNTIWEPLVNIDRQDLTLCETTSF